MSDGVAENQNLKDNWDDAEGYYRESIFFFTISGCGLWAESVVCSLTHIGLCCMLHVYLVYLERLKACCDDSVRLRHTIVVHYPWTMCLRYYHTV